MARKKQGANHVEGEDVAKAGLDLASKSGVPIVQQAAQALKVVTNLAGGVSQDRFIEKTQTVYDIFKKAGYNGVEGNPRNVSYTQFKIGKTGVPDKKKEGTYAPEFERLRQYIIARLNSGNPGLGDLYAVQWPAFIMANKGQMKSEPIKTLKDFVATYPPGTYKSGMKDQATILAQNKINNQTPVSIAPNAEDIRQMNLQMLSQVRPAMEVGLQANGMVPKRNLEDLSEQFYNEIVSKGSGTYPTDNLDEATTQGILSFISTLQAKKLAGEELNPVYDKIASATIKITEKVDQAVKREAGNQLGNWIIENPIPSVLILIVIVLILMKLFRR